MEKRGKHMADITPDEQGLFVMPELDDMADLSAATDAAKEVKPVPDYIMPDRVYDVLKWIALLVCPALATFVSHVGNSWGYAQADNVAITIVEIGLLIGGCIGVSAVAAMGKVNRDWE